MTLDFLSVDPGLLAVQIPNYQVKWSIGYVCAYLDFVLPKEVPLDQWRKTSIGPGNPERIGGYACFFNQKLYGIIES